MNKPLLREVKAAILAQPDAFRMDTWSCGTAHCIAGWALLLRDIPLVADGWLTASEEPTGDVAQELLEITRLQRYALFSNHRWPYSFQRRYLCAETHRERAQVAAERIDHFLKTGE